MQLGAFFVTFNRPTILRNSLEALLAQSRPPEVILVVDNGTSAETKSVVRGFPEDRVLYESTGANLGSAGGTAYGVKRLFEQGYDLIYCGDDDDPPKTPDTLERLLNILKNTDDLDVGGVGVVGSRWDWKKGETRRLPDEALHGLLEVDMIGGNGHLIARRETVQAVGPPDSRLFFGYPDLEYCLRIRTGGFRLLVDGDLMREYRRQAGRLNLNLRRSPLPRRSYGSIWRNYYTTRSYIFMMCQTFNRPDLARRAVLKALGKSLASWQRGPTYGAVFTLLQLRGIVDGYLGRMGPTVLPNPKYFGNTT